jgi:hypothetical protein
MATKITRQILGAYVNCKTKAHLKLAVEQWNESDYESLLVSTTEEIRQQAIGKTVARSAEVEVARDRPLLLSWGSDLFSSYFEWSRDLQIPLEAEHEPSRGLSTNPQTAESAWAPSQRATLPVMQPLPVRHRRKSRARLASAASAGCRLPPRRNARRLISYEAQTTAITRERAKPRINRDSRSRSRPGLAHSIARTRSA